MGCCREKVLHRTGKAEGASWLRLKGKGQEEPQNDDHRDKRGKAAWEGMSRKRNTKKEGGGL